MFLKRVALTPDATFGVLLDFDGVPFAVTLELPWRENQPNQSCIPTGFYQCRRVDSPKFGLTFEVTGVPGRKHILFHPGNLPADTSGCILVAEEYAQINGRAGVAQSRRAFEEFLQKTAGKDEFVLYVTETF